MPTMFGLQQSHALASASGVDPYTPAPFLSDNQWWGNTAQAPAQTAWSAPQYQNFQYQKLGYNTPAPTYQTYSQSAPTYKGLADGDYDRYELSLRMPGETAARRAYDSAKRDLADAYSAKGMYGSSQYTNQMNNQLGRNYMDSMAQNASQATVNRYQMQQKDLQFGAGQDMQSWRSRMQENQAANQQAYQGWQTDYGNKLAENAQMNQLGYQNNAASNQYNYASSVDQRNWNDSQATRRIDFNNALAQDRQNWDLQGLNWKTTQNDAAWGRTYGIWGDYDPEKEQMEKKMMRNQLQQSEGNSGLGGSLGKILGGSVGGFLGSFGGPMGTAFGSGVGGLLGGTAGGLISGV